MKKNKQTEKRRFNRHVLEYMNTGEEHELLSRLGKKYGRNYAIKVEKKGSWILEKTCMGSINS